MNEKLREGLHSIFPVAGGFLLFPSSPRSCRKRLLGLFPNSGKAQRKGEDTTMGDTEYALLLVSVAGGFSDQVIDAAHGAGARGGTVIKGRQRSDERTRQRFGISLQEEQDFVMIVVPREEKTAVMTAINTACGLGAPAHGVVVAMPVEEAMGLE